MIKKSLILLIMVLVLAFPVYSLEKLSYWVNDEANVISPEYEAKIVSEIEELNKNTSVQLAVATVNNLSGKPIEDYSLNLAHNVLGDEKKDNGILILVAVDDREWRIEVGYGLEPYINDALAGRIGRELMVPYFQQGNYSEGILQAVVAIKNILEGKEGYELTPGGQANLNYLVPLIWTIFILLIFVIPAIVRYRQWKKKKTKKEDDVFNAAMFAAILFGGRGHGGGIAGGSSGGFGGFGGGGFGGAGAGGHF